MLRESLSRGLRAAGAVLSDKVDQRQQLERLRNEAIQRQQAQFLQGLIIDEIRNSGPNPELQAALAKLNPALASVPIGQSQSAQLNAIKLKQAQEQQQATAEFSQRVRELQARNAGPEELARVGLQFAAVSPEAARVTKSAIDFMKATKPKEATAFDRLLNAVIGQQGGQFGLGDNAVNPTVPGQPAIPAQPVASTDPNLGSAIVEGIFGKGTTGSPTAPRTILEGQQKEQAQNQIAAGGVPVAGDAGGQAVALERGGISVSTLKGIRELTAAAQVDPTAIDRLAQQLTRFFGQDLATTLADPGGRTPDEHFQFIQEMMKDVAKDNLDERAIKRVATARDIVGDIDLMINILRSKPFAAGVPGVATQALGTAAGALQSATSALGLPKDVRETLTFEPGKTATELRQSFKRANEKMAALSTMQGGGNISVPRIPDPTLGNQATKADELAVVRAQVAKRALTPRQFKISAEADPQQVEQLIRSPELLSEGDKYALGLRIHEMEKNPVTQDEVRKMVGLMREIGAGNFNELKRGIIDGRILDERGR